jgi:hypothetical protein
MALGSTHPVTEISIGPAGRCVRLTSSLPSLSWLSRNCEGLDVSWLYGSALPVTSSHGQSYGAVRENTRDYKRVCYWHNLLFVRQAYYRWCMPNLRAIWIVEPALVASIWNAKIYYERSASFFNAPAGTICEFRGVFPYLWHQRHTAWASISNSESGYAHASPLLCVSGVMMILMTYPYKIRKKYSAMKIWYFIWSYKVFYLLFIIYHPLFRVS